MKIKAAALRNENRLIRLYRTYNICLEGMSYYIFNKNMLDLSCV